MKILRKNSAVSHLMGYMLTLALTTVIITVTIITTNSLIDNKAKQAAEIYAENIANQVSSAISNLCEMKKQYPNAKYTLDLDIPAKLVNRFNYYIEIDDNNAIVESYNGMVKKSCSLYNVTIENAIDVVGGRIDATNMVLKLLSNSTDYVTKFDFGTDSSTLNTNYTKITPLCDNAGWHAGCEEWKYRTIIRVTNPAEEYLRNYQLLVQLNDNNFDYYLANTDGSDLKFVNGNDDVLDYWIERWYPRDTHTSRIWVNTGDYGLAYPEDVIYMYYGNDNPDLSPSTSGKDTFIFFDDFNDTGGSPNSDNWYVYNHNASSAVYIEDGILVLRNGSAVNSTITLDSKTDKQAYVIEAKAKTTDYRREASMFARSYQDPTPGYSPQGSPYDSQGKSYLFSSGSFQQVGIDVDKDLSLIRDNKTGPSNILNSSDIPVGEGWYRLSYLINDSGLAADTICSRYYYENYTMDGLVAVSTEPDYRLNPGRFGLCTTRTNVTAYYDWILVRKFCANLSDDFNTSEESLPTAYITGTDSLDFRWVAHDNLLSSDYTEQGLDYDYVYSNLNFAELVIENTFFEEPLDETPCSLVFTIGNGNPNAVIDNMIITVGYGAGKSISRTFDCEESYKKVKIDVPFIEALPLSITFDDDDGAGPNYYWAVGEVTIQKGHREFCLSGSLQ